MLLQGFWGSEEDDDGVGLCGRCSKDNNDFVYDVRVGLRTSRVDGRGPIYIRRVSCESLRKVQPSRANLTHGGEAYDHVSEANLLCISDGIISSQASVLTTEI
jgi:hypothetical protein